MKTNESLKIPRWMFFALGLVLICLGACGIGGKGKFSPEKEYPTDRIERITKVRVPEYKVTKFVYGPSGIDFSDTIHIEFESVPSDELFEKIDELMAANENSGWYTQDSTHYSFSTFWGNGFPAPEGEKEEDDGIFELEIAKGEKAGVITFGCW
ncbi:MAG: hypothetical protein J5790_04050 [Bacteroidaceae bacterium]|nr:hypothetical protein [Bacteroidaceae bacterium]